ncbi:class I adenylate-forming enzyme family protein [Streptomyces sp. NPDC090052]|uniref:class I adenylate-forming enzyme family protein n=1 Tax=Streptomyces sp. NPDC090052 TaxID=3365931 RepID=UPI003801AA4C
MSGAWPMNMPRGLDYPPVGVDAVLAGAARAYPERVAVRDGDETLTYPELYEQALRVAGGLRGRGIRPGDVVALHMPNSMWFTVAYYGALCAGAAVAPINPAQPALVLGEQLAEVTAKAVITSPAGAGTAVEATAGAASSVELVVCVPPTAAAPARSEPRQGLVELAELLSAEPLRDYRVDAEMVAHLQLTGGTTGRAKAVRVLHRNIVANVVQMHGWRSACLPHLDDEGGLRFTRIPEAVTAHSLTPGDCVCVAVAPLFHGLGLVSQSLNVAAGATVVIAGRFDPDALFADIERYGVTHMGGSPAMYYAMLRSPALTKHDLSSVRLVNSGAAPIDTTALHTLSEHFPRAFVAQGYGLSEATMGVTGAPLACDVETPPDSVGVPVFDTEIQIRGADGTAVLPVGETGEVWVRGPAVADGYHGHPELTALQFRDGWLVTGDMGRLDEHGHLFLVGRSKDLIIYKGYNVYPQPLEEILCSHPAIAQAAVVGTPSESAGEVPVGFVVLRPDVAEEAGRGDEFAEEVMAYVAERVAPYQKVRALHIVGALPLSPTGKILKTELRERGNADD